MLINNLILKTQQLINPLYKNSFILQKIDWLIGLNIFLVIFSSTFMQSDNIGYFAMFAIILYVIKLLTKPEAKFEPKPLDLVLLLYFIFVIISVAGSSLLYLSLKGFLKTFVYLGFYLTFIDFIKSNKGAIKFIFAAFALCACYETVFAFLQNAGMVEEISGWQDMSHLNPEEVMTRVYGTLKPYNPNLFGGYMLAILPSFLVLPFLSRHKKVLTLSSVLLGGLSVIALVLTGCRGAYIGLFFSILTFICILYKLLKPQLKKLFSIIIGACAVFLTLIIVSTSALRARILSIFAMRSDSSNSFRFNVYNSCLHMFKDNWLLGIGCGNQNFREIYGLYMKTGFDALSAYNIYLETAVESGIFALLAFVSFIAGIIYKAAKYIFNSDNTDRIFVLSALLSLIGMLTHGIVDTVFFRPQIQFTFWMMVGVIRILAQRDK